MKSVRFSIRKMTFYQRALRTRSEAENWDEINQEWSKKFDNSNCIKFPEFIQIIKNSFIADPDIFLLSCKKSHKLPAIMPNDFTAKTNLQQICIFFSFFKTIFTFEELDKFVEGPSIGISSFKNSFTKSQYILFDSICLIYRVLIDSLEERDFEKYVPKLCSTFAKFIMPQEGKFFNNRKFLLETVFTSPCFYSGNGQTNVPSFIMLQCSGETNIVNANTNDIILTIKPNELSLIRSDNKIELYSDSFEPEHTLSLPTVDSASCFSSLLLSPPPKGFNHMTVFLKSMKAYEKVKEYFKTSESLVPSVLSQNLSSVLSSSGCELMLYTFMLPPAESKANEKTAPLCLSLIKKKLLPFLRAVIELNWMELSTGGLVFRQNTALTFTSIALLKFVGRDYLNYITGEIKTILSSNVPKFSSTNFSAAEAYMYCTDVFMPCVNTLFGSVTKMPSALRYILRTFFIRTAGHYINNRASLVLLPNIFLLRFIIPELTKPGPNLKFASQLGSAILALFCLTGWKQDREPELYKLNGEFMEPNFQKILPFTLQIIDIEECDMSNVVFDYNENVTVEQLVEFAAERLPVMNLETPNKAIHSHMDVVSVMQMIEEFTFDFSRSK